MAEKERDPNRELHRAPYPVPGKRKPPSKSVQGLPPKQAAREPMHGGPSASLLNALEDVEFPISRADLVDAVGDRVIGLGDGRTVEVRTVIHKIAPAEFGSARDVVSEANAMWDDIDRAAHGE